MVPAANLTRTALATITFASCMTSVMRDGVNAIRVTKIKMGIVLKVSCFMNV